MTQPPMDDDFQDRIQRILNEKKKEDLREQYGMLWESHRDKNVAAGGGGMAGLHHRLRKTI
jgi:hypothetical protein